MQKGPQCGRMSALQCQLSTEVPALALFDGIVDFDLAYILTSE